LVQHWSAACIPGTITFELPIMLVGQWSAIC
jgi:hypothetical protein